MDNPWKGISLSDYENHMSLDSVRQLQSLNQIMKAQLNDYDIHTVMILGVAGGNGLEHVNPGKYQKVYGVDINETYLEAVSERYRNLSETLECCNLDIIHEAERLPKAELVIANLLIEYVGYEAFTKAIVNIEPKYVSCVIQINESREEWVSDSPYIHAFDGLDSVHCQMEENELTKAMQNIGFELIQKTVDSLPNGKSLVRLDYDSKIDFPNKIMYLYHYFDQQMGPFKNISDLNKKDAQAVLNWIKSEKPNSLCAKRDEQYVENRLYFENILRNEFRKKGGRIERDVPHYMVVEHSPWLSTWYENVDYIRIPIEEFDLETVSFTYGDSHPTFSDKVNDGKEYRKKLYTYDEILEVIKKYGLPKDWNDDGRFGPERYIEAHIWSDAVIKKYIADYMAKNK